MDEADNELRDVLCKIWPNHVRKQIKLHEGGTKTLLDLVVPPKHGRHLNHILFKPSTRIISWLIRQNCMDPLVIRNLLWEKYTPCVCMSITIDRINKVIVMMG